MTASTKIQWRVQVRKSRVHKWVNKGLYETRRNAREVCSLIRGFDHIAPDHKWSPPYGFGNTRVVRYLKGN